MDTTIEANPTLEMFLRFVLVSLTQQQADIDTAQRPWHELFYRIRAASPLQCVRGLFFDWDGPYPRSRYLSECWHQLASNFSETPFYERVIIPPILIERWSMELEQLPAEVMEHARQVAALRNLGNNIP